MRHTLMDIGAKKGAWARSTTAWAHAPAGTPGKELADESDIYAGQKKNDLFRYESDAAG
jgi:hypothetical protein